MKGFRIKAFVWGGLAGFLFLAGCGGEEDVRAGVNFRMLLEPSVEGVDDALDIGGSAMALGVSEVTVHLQGIRFLLAGEREQWFGFSGPFTLGVHEDAQGASGLRLPLPPGEYAAVELTLGPGKEADGDAEGFSVEGTGLYQGRSQSAPLRFAFASTSVTRIDMPRPMRVAWEAERVEVRLSQRDWFGDLNMMLELCLAYPPVPFDDEGVLQITGGSNQGCDAVVGLLRQNFGAALERASVVVR